MEQFKIAAEHMLKVLFGSPHLSVQGPENRGNNDPKRTSKGPAAIVRLGLNGYLRGSTPHS